MKKILIALVLVLILCLTSCVQTFIGNVGIVENIELRHGFDGKEPKWKYAVTVRHQNDALDKYKIMTNELYQVGDTIEIKLKQ